MKVKNTFVILLIGTFLIYILLESQDYIEPKQYHEYSENFAHEIGLLMNHLSNNFVTTSGTASTSIQPKGVFAKNWR